MGCELTLFAAKKVAPTIVATSAATVLVVCVVIVPFVVSTYRVLRSRPRHSRSRCPRLLRRLRQDFVARRFRRYRRSLRLRLLRRLSLYFHARFAVTVVVVELVFVVAIAVVVIAVILSHPVAVSAQFRQPIQSPWRHPGNEGIDL